MRLLARRERLECEIRNALRKRGCEEATTEEVIGRLRDMGYLNDERALQRAVDYASTVRLDGPLKTLHRLRLRGADRKAIEEALGSIPMDVVRASALAIIDKRAGRWSGPAQAARFLASRGYDGETIAFVLATRFEAEPEIGEGKLPGDGV